MYWLSLASSFASLFREFGGTFNQNGPPNLPLLSHMGRHGPVTSCKLNSAGIHELSNKALRLLRSPSREKCPRCEWYFPFCQKHFQRSWLQFLGVFAVSCIPGLLINMSYMCCSIQKQLTARTTGCCSRGLWKCSRWNDKRCSYWRRIRWMLDVAYQPKFGDIWLWWYILAHTICHIAKPSCCMWCRVINRMEKQVLYVDSLVNC